MKRIVVVGAGLGGLAAAGLLAKRGYKVKLLERSPVAGGRSHIWKKDGFTMSYGAHALVCPAVDPVKSVLRELDVRLDGARKPSVSGFKLYGGGKLMPGILGTGALTTPAVDGLANRIAFFRAFFAMTKRKPERVPGDMTVEQWIDSMRLAPAAARAIRAYAWLTFYDRALDRLPMRDFAEYAGLLYAKMPYLLYVNYESLLEQMKQAIVGAGGEIAFGKEAVALAVEEGRVKGVVTKDGTEPADRVILNVPPQTLAKLAANTPLADELAPCFGQPAACVYVYDLLLSRRLRKGVTNVLDLDDGVYINDYSLNVPSSAPEGTQLLNALRFLSAEEQADDAHAERSRQAVEAVFDRIYPGWRSCVVGERIIKRAVVNGIARGAGAKRIPLQSRTVGEVYFVGDATEGRGGLGVPAYDSAWRVANRIAGWSP